MKNLRTYIFHQGIYTSIFFLLLVFWWHKIILFWRVPQIPKALLIFFIIIFSLSCIISKNSLILFHLHSVETVWWDICFDSYIFHCKNLNLHYLYVFLFAEIFYHSIHFKRIHLYILYFLLKNFSDHFNNFISALPFVDYLFPGSLDSPDSWVFEILIIIYYTTEKWLSGFYVNPMENVNNFVLF